MRDKKSCLIRAVIGIYLVYIGIRLLIEITDHEPSNMTLLSIFAVVLLGTGIISTIVSTGHIFGCFDSTRKIEGKMLHAFTSFLRKSKEKEKIRSGDTMEMNPNHPDKGTPQKVRRPEVRELTPDREEDSTVWQEAKRNRRQATIIKLAPKEKTNQPEQVEKRGLSPKETVKKETPKQETVKKDTQEQAVLDSHAPKQDSLAIEIIEGGTRFYSFHSANDSDEKNTSSDTETDFEER